jgi:hypothetical protein
MLNNKIDQKQGESERLAHEIEILNEQVKRVVFFS